MPPLGSGTLQQGQWYDLPYVLQAGVTYTFVVQSPDRALFDLDLFDQNANQVDTSPVVGQVAACEVTPMWTGGFTIRVICRQYPPGLLARFTLFSEP